MIAFMIIKGNIICWHFLKALPSVNNFHCILRAITANFWDKVFSLRIWGHFIQQCISFCNYFKKSYHYNSASLLSTSESSLSRKTQIIPRRDSLQQLLFVTVGNFTAYASFSRKIHSNKSETGCLFDCYYSYYQNLSSVWYYQS